MDDKITSGVTFPKTAPREWIEQNMAPAPNIAEFRTEAQIAADLKARYLDILNQMVVLLNEAEGHGLSMESAVQKPQIGQPFQITMFRVFKQF
jgi:hypothetical protein